MAYETAYLSPNGQTQTIGTAPPLRLQVATVEGIATLMRNGPAMPWMLEHDALQDVHLGALLHDPLSGKLFAGAHGDGGIWVSHDNGLSWQACSTGLDRPHVYALAGYRSNGGTVLLAGTDPAGLYRSDDLGETWAEVPSIHTVPDTDKWTFPAPPHVPHVKSLTVHPQQPECFFVLVEQGALLRTVDGGQSFEEIQSYSSADDSAYRDVHRLLIDPEDRARMFLATGEGLYRSFDEGKSWAQLTGPRDRLGYPDHIFFDPREPDNLFMAGTDTDPGEWFRTGTTSPGLLQSSDGGDSWQEIDLGLPPQAPFSIEAMCQHVWIDEDGAALGHTLIMGSAAGHIWSSDDNGVTWIEAETRIAPVSKDHHHLPFKARKA